MPAYSVVFNSLQPQGLQPTRFLFPWDYPSKNTESASHSAVSDSSQLHGLYSPKWVAISSFKGIFPIQGWNLHLLHWQAESLLLSHLGSQPPKLTSIFFQSISLFLFLLSSLSSLDSIVHHSNNSLTSL